MIFFRSGKSIWLGPNWGIMGSSEENNQDNYDKVWTNVCGETEDFTVKWGVHQGLSMSPY